jgi:hypothetical protein
VTTHFPQKTNPKTRHQNTRPRNFLCLLFLLQNLIIISKSHRSKTNPSQLPKPTKHPLESSLAYYY